ncbi:hypothetical protein Bbelb_245690 [Branchiostoma belcheri]|nr:hypothetical protein Bbelb_245690 [Branchiostoma belcheri]
MDVLVLYKSAALDLGIQWDSCWRLWLIIRSLVFKANPENSGKFIQSRLWSIGQHPNYLGEISLWVGLYITAAGAMSGWEHIISGVPLLDELGMKRWGNNPGYLAYRQRTAVLVPFVW